MDNIAIFLSPFLNASRSTKRVISISYDTVALLLSAYLALITSGAIFDWSDLVVWAATSVFISSSLFAFIKLGFYRAILRYMGLQAIFVVSLGLLFSTLSFVLASSLAQFNYSPITVLIYWSFSLVAIGGIRLIFVAYLRNNQSRSSQNVIVYGAGQSARQLAKALGHSQTYRIIAYLDDDPSLLKAAIDGVKIYSPSSARKLIHKYDVSHVFLAIPSASHARRARVLTQLEALAVKVKTIPAFNELITGKLPINQLQDIEIEDLLGRDPVPPDTEKLRATVSGRVVMVTGAGGSIGAELCRQIIKLSPAAVILYELSEFALYSIEKELLNICKEKGLNLPVTALLGSVQHKNRLVKIMRRYQVKTLFHAAAYKHVPIVEQNIIEGIRNNVFGTWYAAEAAIESGVERFVLISTDKAVRPTNVMGASKRLAELVLQALSQRGEKTLFTMVRFGNVLGSSGSVVPLFREQIQKGGPVTVTHKDIIRYFMTIPEAAQLVLQAAAMAKGGDVFVLDMGEQVKIAELAEKLIHLMGYTVKSTQNPSGDIEVKYSGLRPGEKLFEELLIGENVAGTTHPKIMTAQEESVTWNDMSAVLVKLDTCCHEMNCEAIVQLLLKLPIGYNPQHKVCDLLWNEDQKSPDNIVKFKTLN